MISYRGVRADLLIISARREMRYGRRNCWRKVSAEELVIYGGFISERVSIAIFAANETPGTITLLSDNIP